MDENREGQIRTLRRADAEVRSAVPGQARERKRGEAGEPYRSAAGPSEAGVEPLIERIGTLESKLEVELAALRDTIEIHGLHLFSKAIEALSSLEADWMRARSEVDSLKERLQEATSGSGELQRQLERIAELRRAREAELHRELETSRRELEAAQRELVCAREAQQVANEQREAAERECHQLLQRISWRVTSPLRYVRSLFPKAQG
jgi:hypothetical protein